MSHFQGYRLKSLLENKDSTLFRFIAEPFANGIGLRFIPSAVDHMCGSTVSVSAFVSGHLRTQGMIGLKYTMPPVAFQDLFLNIYMVIFAIGISVFILSLVFCCCFIRSWSGGSQTCAVCLEDFRISEELGMLPCQHGFHK
ncbi:hypothetical protein P4O66_006019, partial [Electrophorus voltai]